jgi:DNA polymerase I-like protein with 3'-5' exonuclease and polymerase domains
MQPTILDAYNLMHEGTIAFSHAEQNGMRIDVEYCHKKKKHIDRKINRALNKLEQSKIVKDWKRQFGNNTNLDSDHQLGKILFELNGIEPVKTTASGKGAVDEESLKELSKEIKELQYIIDIRKLRKIRDTYLDAFLREQVNGYIHPFLNLHTVRTYRSSSNSPNLQNIPKRDKEAMKICRRAIFPRPGHQLIEVDFGALEVSIAACYHKDRNMLKYLTSDNTDMHGDVAAQIFMVDGYDKKKYPGHKYIRNATKNSFIFPQFYGDYYGNNVDGLCKWCSLPHTKWRKGYGVDFVDGKTIGDHLISKGIKSYDAFKQRMKDIEDDFWNNRFREYGRWKVRWHKQYQKKGYFDTYTGFRCKGVMSKNEVINYPVQGAAFHCLLWSFIQIYKISVEENWDSRIVNQIHDAVIVDVHPDELEHVCKTIVEVTCKKLQEHWNWIIVPLTVDADICDVDAPWSEKKSFTLPEV